MLVTCSTTTVTFVEIQVNDLIVARIVHLIAAMGQTLVPSQA
jgi:hypothetical protein